MNLLRPFYLLHQELTAREFRGQPVPKSSLSVVRFAIDLGEMWRTHGAHGIVEVMRDRLGLEAEPLAHPEHGDHPDYACTLVARYCDDVSDATWSTAPDDPQPAPEMPEYLRRGYENHDLVYTDGCVALTLHEYCYALWSVSKGECLGGSLWRDRSHVLTPESLEKLKRYARRVR